MKNLGTEFRLRDRYYVKLPQRWFLNPSPPAPDVAAPMTTEAKLAAVVILKKKRGRQKPTSTFSLFEVNTIFREKFRPSIEFIVGIYDGHSFPQMQVQRERVRREGSSPTGPTTQLREYESL